MTKRLTINIHGVELSTATIKPIRQNLLTLLESLASIDDKVLMKTTIDIYTDGEGTMINAILMEE